MQDKLKADAIGLAVLAGEWGLLAGVLRSLDVPLWGWTLCYVVVALIALGVWHGKKWPDNSKGVLKQVLGSVLLGALFFAADLVLGHFSNPELPLIKAAEHSGSIFGFGLTVLVCPVLTTVLLGGYFRAIFLEASGATSASDSLK